MSEERRLYGAIKCRQLVPEAGLALWQPRFATLVPRVNGLGCRAFLQTGSPGGKRRRVKSDLQAASGESEPVKGRQHEVVQHGLERDRWTCCQRIP